MGFDETRTKVTRGASFLVCVFQIRRRRLARLGAVSTSGPAPTGVSAPVTPGASVPSPDAQPSRLSPALIPRSSTETNLPDPSNPNKEPNYSDGVNKEEDPTKLPADGLIVTEKADNNLIDEMPDTKMTDLSQTRQYNSFDSMGDDTLLSCGSVRVGSLPQSTVGGGSEVGSNREDSTSRSISPAQFVEPSPVRPRAANASPSCSRRSLSMEVDDVPERNSQTEMQHEPMEVSLLCNF